MTGNIAFLAAGVGAGLAVLGAAGYGIGRATAAAMEGIARQPAANGELRTSLTLGAGFIEGAAIIGLLVCMLLSFK